MAMAMIIHQKSWLVFLFLHAHLGGVILAQPDLRFASCGSNGNYTENSAYHNTLNTLLSSLPSNMDEFGFYNTSVIAQDNERISAVMLCRGDQKLEECRGCVNNVVQKVTNSCPNQKEAFVGYDECILQYSNQSIIGTVSFTPRMFMFNSENASRPEEYNDELRKLVDDLRDRAANGDPRRKYASGDVAGPNFQRIFALVQCAPDLNPQNCSDCLTESFRNMINCPCNGKRGGRIIGSRCNFRYESNRFFNIEEAPPPAPPASPPPAGDENDKTARTIIIIVVPIVVVILIIGISVIMMKKRQKKKLMDETESIRTDDISTAESFQYDFSTVRAATDNFSNANKLGQGGFGPVYKGKLPNGEEVAVKRLSADSGQGDLEFKNEVVLVARLQHRNLVRLLGFCLDRTERLLIYEFVPNASLDQFLFDPVKRGELDWERRSKIISGVARGILYLHEDSRLRIIHRDLKASNVLLDADMNPKISDFGMAKLFTLDETQGNTSRIVGTYGYMPPEYAMHGQFSVKSDVYSFGVLVLEILSGQKNTCFRNGESMLDLLSYVWKHWREGTASNLIDPMLRGSSGVLAHDIMRCIHIALLCVQENVADRPTMAAVFLMLSSVSMSLPLPSGPSYSMRDEECPEISFIQEYNSRSTSGSKEIAKSKSVGSSRNEASITELYPR